MCPRRGLATSPHGRPRADCSTSPSRTEPVTGTKPFMPLLPEWDARLPWSQQVGALTATETLQGSPDTDLLVVDATAPGRPTRADLNTMWRRRSNGGIAPVLLLVRYWEGDAAEAALLGLDEDAVPTMSVPVELAERIAADALVATSPTRLDAEYRRRVQSVADGGASGLRNEGLLASHVLDQALNENAWAELGGVGRGLLSGRGRELLGRLGYQLDVVPDGTVLRDKQDGRRRAAAVLLSEGESFDNPLVRLAGANAVAHGLSVAQREGVDWLVVSGGPVLRLYPSDPDVGVGRKGQTQTYVELDLSLLTDAEAAYLPLLFSPAALREQGYLATLLDQSTRFAAGLAQRLRERIYDRVMKGLAEAVARRTDLVVAQPETQRRRLDEAYHRAMIVLFRLLFVAYGEDRGLLPYTTSERYRRNALKTLALDMLADPDAQFSRDSTTLWDDLTQVWKVIDTGDLESWGVPPYNGGLFTRDATKNPSGAATYALDLTNAEIGPVLRGLLVDDTPEGEGPVDFRSLSVREFGTIYEGLLESGLDVAHTALTRDGDGDYRPATGGGAVVVAAGEAFFHRRSGSRKGSGSYFTKPFAVEHLLDSALEPALDRHLDRVADLLEQGKSHDAAATLFDFRVTDLAMGSAHFLVAAIDRIEARFSAFITAHPMPEALAELAELRTAAASRLRTEPSEAGIDDAMLLRRQIARRCIYGIDINEIAVELARLAIWIHTFVPGLPLSFLNHGLVHGNSLTGVGTAEDITAAIAEAEKRELRKSAGTTTSLTGAVDEFMRQAEAALLTLGTMSDASVSDVAEASSLQAQIDIELEPLARLCDLITAERATRHLGTVTLEEVVYGGRHNDARTVRKRQPHPDRVIISANPDIFTAVDSDALRTAILNHPHLERAQRIARDLQATHLPLRFPEVFRSARRGFDVVLGNPPWDKVRHEPQQYWVAIRPGLNRLPDEQRKKAIAQLREDYPVESNREQFEMSFRAVLQAFFKTTYTLRGGTHVELAQLMLERALTVQAPEGRLGLVLPRQFTVLAGWKNLRRAVLHEHSAALIQARNTGEWIFEGIHQSYAIVLLSCGPWSNDPIPLWVASSAIDVAQASRDGAITLSRDEIEQLSDTDVLPWFGVPGSRQVFDKMRTKPRLATAGGWVTGAHDARWDFRGTGPDKSLAVTNEQPGDWRILMTAHVVPFALSSSEPFKQYVHDTDGLVAKRRGIVATAQGVRASFTHPTVVLRHPSRSDDSRTLIAAALPELGVLHNKGYVHAVSCSSGTTPTATLALLGLLNTMVEDWWARRFVDRHITAPVVNRLPLPDWSEDAVEEAAALTSALLHRGGVHAIPGGTATSDDYPGQSDLELRVRLERLAAEGFELTASDLAIIATDFSLKGVPAGMRTALDLNPNEAADEADLGEDDE